MRRFWALMGLFIVAGFTVASPQTDVLERSLKVNEGIETFEAEFVQITCTKATGICQRFEGKLWLKRPEKFRMEVMSPDTQLFVSDGETMWIYLPKSNQAIKEDLKKTELLPQPSQVLFEFSEKYEIDFKGEDKVKKKTYYLLNLKPKEESPYFIAARVWLNLESLLMERLMVTDGQGNETILNFREVEINLTLPEDKFTFTPPEGVEAVEGMGGRQIR